MFTQNKNIDQLEVKTDTGAEIEIKFNSGECSHLYIDEYEYDAADDILKNIFIKFEGQFYTILGVMQRAIDEYDDICDETRQEEEDEYAMERELSSPYMTGRI